MVVIAGNAMNEISSEPKPPPSVPRGPLWASLAVPPALTFVFTSITALTIQNVGYGDPFLWIPLVMFFVILICTGVFHQLLKVRYHGRSVVFMDIGYLIGQVVICLAVWIGACVITLS
jgi:hypothetical protein